jgi:hypothetical protein
LGYNSIGGQGGKVFWGQVHRHWGRALSGQSTGREARGVVSGEVGGQTCQEREGVVNKLGHHGKLWRGHAYSAGRCVPFAQLITDQGALGEWAGLELWDAWSRGGCGGLRRAPVVRRRLAMQCVALIMRAIARWSAEGVDCWLPASIDDHCSLGAGPINLGHHHSFVWCIGIWKHQICMPCCWHTSAMRFSPTSFTLATTEMRRTEAKRCGSGHMLEQLCERAAHHLHSRMPCRVCLRRAHQQR